MWQANRIGRLRSKLRRLFEAVPLILARSQSLADRLMQLGCPPERMRINRTGVPLGEFPLMQRDRRWTDIGSCFRLAASSRRKASPPPFARSPFCKENSRTRNFPSPAKDRCNRNWRTCRAAWHRDKVHFCGFVSQEELSKLYAKAHLFLHPSETPPDQNQEGVPNSVLEAMSTGLPVVATQHGGIPEAVEHGRTGLLVEEGDFVSLAESIATVLRSPHAFREMGWLASEFVAVNFEQSEQIRQLESFYDEAIEMSRVEEKAAATERERLPAGFRNSSRRVRLAAKAEKFRQSCLVIRTKPALVCATKAPVVSAPGLCGRAWAKRIGPLPSTRLKMYRLFIAATFDRRVRGDDRFCATAGKSSRTGENGTRSSSAESRGTFHDRQVHGYELHAGDVDCGGRASLFLRKPRHERSNRCRLACKISGNGWWKVFTIFSKA